ncbi:hypothetical protein [Klebsiella pneumoniae]|uniref:hypothetical protein n=1 Tax=Klebsiella pneumoniae TaxID=573 RepID=UPI0024BD74A1|nr:hypothetical protein [Klebsiella pneumoniae]
MNFELSPLLPFQNVIYNWLRNFTAAEANLGVKITGIDKLQKQLKEVEEAAETLNGSYPVSFDANDPVGIETAIQEAYSMLEERASRYAANPMISPMIEAMKEDLRQQILDSAEQREQENWAGWQLTFFSHSKIVCMICSVLMHRTISNH